MTNNLSQKVSSWLVWRPLKFAAISILLMTAAVFGFNLITIGLLKMNAPGPITTTIVLGLAVLVATIIYIWRLPRENFDRPSFVALNTAQMFVLGVAFLLSSAVIIINAPAIMNGAWMMRVYFNPFFTVMMLAVAVFYMYLIGLMLTNVYVKYRRVRAMGVAPWRAICSMPFGFAMLWIAGYILPAPKKEKSQIVPLRAAWYTKLTNAIIATPLRATIMVAILILISAAFFPYENTITTLAMGVIFAICWRIMGAEKLYKNIPNKYATGAVVMNIIVLATLIIIGTITTQTTSDVHVNIQDIAPTHQAQ